MKKVYAIGGMTCHNCENTINNGISKIKGVKSVTSSFKFGKAIVEFDNIDDKLVKKTIEDLGYKYDGIYVGKNKARLKEILPIVIFLIAIYILIGSIFGYNFLTVIPSVTNGTPIMMLFIIGIFTSVHCIGMCGAINLAASLDSTGKTTFKRPFLYNLGRVISYTLIGGIIGAIGGILSINTTINGIIVLLSSILMLFMGLSMLGWLPVSLYMFIPKYKTSIKLTDHEAPFLIGLLNGLMPCGPLQAMQIYALSTGSFIMGALSLFIFSLGTVPLVFSFGFIFNKLGRKYNVIISRVSSVLVVMLALVMLTRGFNYLGIDVVGGIKNIVTPKTDYSKYAVASIKDGYQYVEITLNYRGYQPIVVQKGIPVKFNIKTKDVWKFGCTNAINIPSLGIEYSLKEGDNIIEFTPKKVGTINYSCWMGMVNSHIKVVEDIGDIYEQV